MKNNPSTSNDIWVAILLILFTVFMFYKVFTGRKIKKLKKSINDLDEKSKNYAEQIELYKPKAEKFDKLRDFEEKSKAGEATLKKLEDKLKNIQEKLDPLQEYITLEESGFYRFQYDFEDVDKYADALKLVKDSAKALIKSGDAIVVDVSELENSTIIKELSKLAVRAFNLECESIISKVKFNNFDSCKDKIISGYDTINKCLSTVRMRIAKEYLELKINELAVGFEHEEEKEKIKQEQAEILAQMREEEKARVEAEKAREKAVKEEEKYQQALDEARKELEGKSDAEKSKMQKQIEELETKLKEAHEERTRATSMAQITKAGNVYIISNIGSFGENVYKIGLTRRKDPMDRVKELGDASVPFQFDVHAMIYSENAPSLEHELQSKFNNRRMNKINNRKEFFKVTLDDIENTCRDMGYKIKFTRAAEAREYRETLAIENG